MRILVAEDETIIRLDLVEMLARAGLEVCAEARDGEEAVTLAREHAPDLAIMDVKMPRLDGIEAARRILDERPIPIVMLTAYGQEELVNRAVEAGVFGYLVKPFREQDLLPGAEDDRARERIADEDGGPFRTGRVRAAAEGLPGLGPPAKGRGRGGRRHARRQHGLTEPQSKPNETRFLLNGGSA